MLRRCLVVPAPSQLTGRFQQFCYLPPGNHALRMPWISETSTIKSAESNTAVKMNKTTALGGDETPSASAQLGTFLDAQQMCKQMAVLGPLEEAGSGAGGNGGNGGGLLHGIAAQGGPLRVTSACRMPALAGPTLDTRIGDILKISDSFAAEMLPDVVRLLIDPNAEGVENVSLSDFAAMQPKRQLAAVGGKKAWYEWLVESVHYKQVARLELESPFYDLRALRQAGITTLYQWAEQPDLVKVSACTRSLLDSAVEKSVETYVEEVVKLVNKSNEVSDLLASWVADTVGKFILDTLHLTVDQAAAAQRSSGAAAANAVLPTLSVSSSLHTVTNMAAAGEAVTDMLTMAAMDTTTESPGRACTLEHFHRLAKKILASVRKEYMSQWQLEHGVNNESPSKTVLDSQAEAEIREKAYTTLSDALLKVLETQAQKMPKELHSLRDDGFLAFERIPGLLRQAAAALQLQNVPVRYFVFHSTGNCDMSEFAKNDIDLAAMGVHDEQLISNVTGTTGLPLTVTPPTLMSGMFLAGTGNYNITLGEWPGYPQPNPASSCSIWSENPLQNEYFSVLHRLKRHTIRVARTSLFEAIKGADEFRNGFNAAEALGLQQLFGSAKLVEDRLASVLNCHSTTSPTFRPVHFVEAGHSCGKSSLLERLSKRMLDNGKRSVIVRYCGSTTPFTPGLDDHPLAFPARFWFRVALGSCPYLVRTEELFTRAPKSVMWWANRLNWSWELYQRRILLSGCREGGTSSLRAIFIDDIDRVLDAMESRLVAATAGAGGMLKGASRYHFPSLMFSGDAVAAEDKEGGGKAKVITTATPTTLSDGNDNSNNVNYNKAMMEKNCEPSGFSGSGLRFKNNHVLFHSDLIDAALAKVTVAVGQLDMVFTAHHTSGFFLAYADTPVRRYFMPLSNGIGLQQRLRVLPLISVLYALHQRSRLEFSGLMYEVLKNCPGLLGHTLDVFWSGRAALMDLRGGAPRLMQWSGTHPLLRSYVPAELFAELPQRNYLLQNLPEARLRLVELLQRQLSSPTGYLVTGVDSTMQDERDGIVVPYNHTACQVHPFALFTIFTHQDPLESPQESMVVRAWGEVWAEYCAVVNTMGTTNERKRDALRVLLHGALLLRAVAVSGAKVDLNLKIPPYGFPLLASPTRVKAKGSTELVITKPTVDLVRKAAAAYKSFFMQTEQSHIPFRPSLGLNGGCDVVSISGSTLALYDLVTTPEALQNINYRFAETLLGVLHCLRKNVLPQHKIRQIHYVSVVSIDQTTAVPLSSGKVSVAGSTVSSVASDDVFAPPPTSVVPYFLDLSAVFEDEVIDKLRALQEILDISQEFRTLNDLLDELDSVHNVHVHQDVVASQEELESLLSATLMQLVPDATVLPAHTAEVVSPDTLLMDLLVDEEEESFRGAEVEELHRDVILAKEGGPMAGAFADAEHVQESAELLEALLNDSLLDPQQQSARERITNEATQAALLTDIAVEDAINNNMPLAADVVSAQRQGTLSSFSSSSSAAAQEDALAWLHDIVTPTATNTLRGCKAGDLTLATTVSDGTSRRIADGGCAFVSLNSEELTDGGKDNGEEGENKEETASGKMENSVTEKEEESSGKTRSFAKSKSSFTAAANSNNKNNDVNERSSKNERSRHRSRQQEVRQQQQQQQQTGKKVNNSKKTSQLLVASHTRKKKTTTTQQQQQQQQQQQRQQRQVKKKGGGKAAVSSYSNFSPSSSSFFLSSTNAGKKQKNKTKTKQKKAKKSNKKR